MTTDNKSLKPSAKVFVANRGEIAMRIATTLSSLGMKSCGMYDPAKESAHLMFRYFDELIKTNHPRAFLDIPHIIKMAKDSRCQAIHPGYGFLSENPEFAEACRAADLVWIGPSPKAIQAMSSKAAAREIANSVSCPVIPGYGPFQADRPTKDLYPIAESIGYPLLVKASYGGGGKGMRVVNQSDELASAVSRGASEALNSFGNAELILEKFIQAPRHIEVQVVCDQHGHHFVLGDRECSVQRRHQKIIEEAPAPALSESLRIKLHHAAMRIAQAVNYDSVGTLEFIVEGEEFYFLEMNTRIQVEHTVTEEVFGVDLISLQIKAASGESLAEELKSLPTQPRGHAFQARLCAENPLQNFAPCPGPLLMMDLVQGQGIRWEKSLDAGEEISGQYDPMFAKLIVKAERRTDAIRKLERCLQASCILGVTHNATLILEILKQDDFLSSKWNTRQLDKWDLSENLKSNIDLSSIADLKSYLIKFIQGSGKVSDQMWEKQKSIYTSRPLQKESPRDFEVKLISLSTSKAGQDVKFVLSESQVVNGKGLVLIEGKETLFWFCINKSPRMETFLQVCIRSHYFKWDLSPHRQNSEEGQEDQQALNRRLNLAPMAGRVLHVRIEAGQDVSPGEVLIVLESMKMEIEVKATAKMKISRVLVNAGNQVFEGQVLYEEVKVS